MEMTPPKKTVVVVAHPRWNAESMDFRTMSSFVPPSLRANRSALFFIVRAENLKDVAAVSRTIELLVAALLGDAWRGQTFPGSEAPALSQMVGILASPDVTASDKGFEYARVIRTLNQRSELDVLELKPCWAASAVPPKLDPRNAWFCYAPFIPALACNIPTSLSGKIKK